MSWSNQDQAIPTSPLDFALGAEARLDREQLRREFERMKRLKLVLSLGIDAAGIFTYLLPGVGEAGDIAWAPIAAAANYLLHGGSIGAAGGLFTLVEEGLPFTDIIPSVTITWFVRYVLREEAAFRHYVQSRTGAR